MTSIATHAETSSAVHPLFNVDPQTREVSFNWAGPPAEMRAKILQLRTAILSEWRWSYPYATARFVDEGQFTRQVLVPRGTVFVAKIPRRDSVQVIAAGEISLLTEFGTARAQAGSVALACAGIVTIGFAHSDTIIVNVFRTDLINPALIEAEVDYSDSAPPGASPLCQ